jgi:hypothetical protein
MTPNYLDTLPADVINYVIMPYLEWEERINLNRLMPPGDRAKGKRMLKINITKHVSDAIVQGKALRGDNLADFINTPGRKSAEIVPAVIDYMDSFTKGMGPVLLNLQLKIRKVCREKIVEFTSPEHLNTIESEEMRDNLLDTCLRLSAILNKFKD